jgi:hypothetical protein
MALVQYARATISVDGKDLFEEASVTISRATNSQAVSTVHWGYNGETPGAPMCELSVDNAVPSSAIEFDPGPYMLALTSVGGPGPNGIKFVIDVPGGPTMQFDGFIVSDNFSHAINSSSKITFSARGRFETTWE